MSAHAFSTFVLDRVKNPKTDSNTLHSQLRRFWGDGNLEEAERLGRENAVPDGKVRYAWNVTKFDPRQRRTELAGFLVRAFSDAPFLKEERVAWKIDREGRAGHPDVDDADNQIDRTPLLECDLSLVGRHASGLTMKVVWDRQGMARLAMFSLQVKEPSHWTDSALGELDKLRGQIQTILGVDLTRKPDEAVIAWEETHRSEP